MSEELENKLLKAKIDLMTRSAFISTITLSLNHIITTDVPTAAISGTTVKYNPNFIKNMSTTQFAALIAHECWHLAFQHAARKGPRDHFMWNVAGDYAINHMLNKGGFEIGSDWLISTKYNDEWSTDAIYEDLIKNKPEIDPDKFMFDLEDCPAGPDRHSEITDIVVKARTQSQISGEDPGMIPNEIARMIDELINPKLPWPVILNRFLDQRTRDEYSWGRRNRRYQRAYLPSLNSIGLGHLTFAIDTSGSIDDKELQEMLSEIQGVRDVYNPEHMTIIDCDAVIHNVFEVDQNTDILSLKFTGNGGTRFKPVLDYVAKHPTQALIYFTDLYGEEKMDPVEYPLLWICNSDHGPACIGETVYANP